MPSTIRRAGSPKASRLFLSGEEIPPENIEILRQLDSEGQLFSLRSLNAGFPSTDRERTIAYLESYSALRYIVEEFGTEKLKTLLAAISEGNATDDGSFVQALGVTVGRTGSAVARVPATWGSGQPKHRATGRSSNR